MILLIDNYDSFVFNLQRYLQRLGQTVCVVRNDAPEVRLAVEQGELPCGTQAVVISPGPKSPADAGYCVELVRRHFDQVPILGVCLGHQVIFEAFGGRIVRAPHPLHGRSSQIRFEHSRLTRGLPSKLEFARYHSLVADSQSCPESLQITAWSDDRQVMAIEHRQQLCFGIQFHPESILSTTGYALLRNFLQLANLHVGQDLPASDLLDPLQLVCRGPQAELPRPLEEYAVLLPGQKHW